MLTRTLATLTLLLTLTAGTEATPPAAVHLGGALARSGHRAHIVDDTEGCREPAPSAVPVAPATCTDEGQP